MLDRIKKKKDHRWYETTTHEAGKEENIMKKEKKYIAPNEASLKRWIGVLMVGSVVSFVVSMLVIRALMEYVRKHSFSVFGVYRIVLGIIVLGYFLLK